MSDETVKIIQEAVEKADDTTIALDYIKSAIVLDCTESVTADDGHVMTDEEKQVIIARLLMKALSMFDDYEMPELIKHLNDGDENSNHDEHIKLLLKLVDAEFGKLRKEHKRDAFLEKMVRHD